jgi:hypothetical protein
VPRQEQTFAARRPNRQFHPQPTFILRQMRRRAEGARALGGAGKSNTGA